MFKCTGICSGCGRCMNAATGKEYGERKAKMLSYPEGFAADKGEGLAAAFDVGTTTVAAVLWDFDSGEQIATEAASNPQRKYGADVISRIAYCRRDEERLNELRRMIAECISELAVELCRKCGRRSKDIKKVAVCGNTTMSHIFAGFSPEGLAMAPFTPAYRGTLKLSADKAMLDLPGCEDVTVIPNIAGHVGGDITAGIAASGILEMEGLTLFMDIGTNGELVLIAGDEIYVCSTAAGPAFEGASIKCGMRASKGAIEKVSIEGGKVLLKTIDDCEPEGICGSGLIDAVAQMLDAGLIDSTGRLAAADEAEVKGFDSGLTDRLVTADEERQFVLAFREANTAAENIVITQKDIREVQLAKGAIEAGVTLMLKRAGKNVSDLDRVVVAGAFGNFIDKSSAMRIGLIPQMPQGKIISAGNTAGAGVSMALVNAKAMELIEKIPESVQHVELAEEPEFQNVYLMSMGF